MDYTSVIDSLVNGFKDIVANCVNVASSIIPIGLGIIGLSKVFSVAKSFFNKSVGSDSGSSYKYETNFEGWAAENDLDIYADYDYDIDE